MIEWVPPSTSQQFYQPGQDQGKVIQTRTVKNIDTHFDDNKNNHGPIFASMMAAQSVFPITDETVLSNEDTKQYIQFDFCMTNPPFYSSVEDATLPRQGDLRKRTDMTLEEGFYPNGGEEGFVLDMIQDSLQFQNHFTWYTSMLGKKSSLVSLEKKLKDMGFGSGQIRTTSFVQGNNTRWGIAWTFHRASWRSPGTCSEIGSYSLMNKKICIWAELN